MTPAASQTSWVRRATIAIVILCFAVSLSIVSYRLAQSQDAVAALKQSNQNQAAAILRNHQVLAELCKTNAIVSGLVGATAPLFEAVLQIKTLPPLYRTIYQDAFTTFRGYQSALNQQTSCAGISRP